MDNLERRWRYFGAIPSQLMISNHSAPVRRVVGWLNSTSLTTTQLQTSLSGLGNLLITDSQGRRIGLVGDQFVNEIPGAFGSSLPGGLGIPTDPTYHLPLTETYSILLDGQALTQKGTTAVTQFGPGYAAWFENITVGPTTQDHLIIAPDGRQLAYAPNEVREVTLSFALDDITASRKLQIHGADIGGGQVVTLTADVVQGISYSTNRKLATVNTILRFIRTTIAESIALFTLT